MRIPQLSWLAALPVVVVVACGGSGSDGASRDGGADPGDAGGACPEGAEGTRIADQVAGDCAAIVCAADGTTRSIPDDSDVPEAAECVVPTCTNGAKGSSPKAAGTPCTGGVCDGAGACALGPGAPCESAAACVSGFCADGVCCNEACNGVCKACDNEGSKGTCSNIAYYREDPRWVPEGTSTPVTCDSAISGARCDGQGQCLRTVGVACNGDMSCMSGKCSNAKCLGAKDELCSASQECASGTCAGGVCL